MTITALAMALSPVTSTPASKLPVSTTLIVIIVIVAVLGGLTILGWRSPDRPPHADEKAERDRVDD